MIKHYNITSKGKQNGRRQPEGICTFNKGDAALTSSLRDKNIILREQDPSVKPCLENITFQHSLHLEEGLQG